MEKRGAGWSDFNNHYGMVPAKLPGASLVVEVLLLIIAIGSTPTVFKKSLRAPLQNTLVGQQMKPANHVCECDKHSRFGVKGPVEIYVIVIKLRLFFHQAALPNLHSRLRIIHPTRVRLDLYFKSKQTLNLQDSPACNPAKRNLELTRGMTIMEYRKLTFILIILTFCMAPGITPTTATEPEPAPKITAEQWGVILNLSGRQRMLTQKMSKETLLIVADIDAPANRKNLSATLNLFETTLAGLRDGDSTVNLPPTANSRIVKQLDKVLGLYTELKPVFEVATGGGVPSAEQLTQLEQNNLPLLKNMNKVVKMYERESRKTLVGNTDLAVVINLAGKQRMLTQKMAKEYLFVFLEINQAENRLRVRETSSLFRRTLIGLLDGDTDLELPGTTEPKIRAQLAIVASLWETFAPVIAPAAQTDVTLARADAIIIANTNVPLLKNMNKAVKMYEILAKEDTIAAGDS